MAFAIPNSGHLPFGSVLEDVMAKAKNGDSSTTKGAEKKSSAVLSIKEKYVDPALASLFQSSVRVAMESRELI